MNVALSKMADCCQGAPNDREDVADPPQARPVEGGPPNLADFDFIERPSEDFFCPVTLELLLDPHQTRCCGNHLSEKVVLRLQRDGKPCPMCKNPQLDTVTDKFHGRKVKAVRVRCPRTAMGCEWEGEVSGLQKHVNSCPKRPWKCLYCEFASTYDYQANHEEQCTHYPMPCPNKCEIGMVPRCDVESHCKKCPLELVSCDYADIGCNVKIPRQDLRKHMEESQQQHILSATFFNLRLSRETIAEKDRQLAEKDHQLAEKDRQLTEKDHQLAGKDHLLADKDRQLAEKDHQLADNDGIIKRKDEIIANKEMQMLELQKQIKTLQASVDHVMVGVDHLLGGRKHCRLFTVDTQEEGWLSKPFYSHRNGYKLRLSVKNCIHILKVDRQFYGFTATFKAVATATTSAMSVCLVLCKGEFDHQLDWPVTFYVDLQLQNRVNAHKHIQQSYEYFFLERCEYQEMDPSERKHFTTRAMLYTEGANSSPYVVNDSMELRLWIHS